MGFKGFGWVSVDLDRILYLWMGFSGFKRFPDGVEGFQWVWKFVSGCGRVSVFVDLLHPNHPKTNKTTQNANFVILKYKKQISQGKLHDANLTMQILNASFIIQFEKMKYAKR